MLMFHEGLPRSGKSYESMKLIEKALKKGRKVFAHVEGLNFVKWAHLIEKDVVWVKEHLIYIDENQVKEIWKHIEKDSLVIIDEAQDYWPASRNQPSEDLSKFVARHGHDGLDIVLMGQALEDCHNIWKRRIDRKIVFQKRDALGQDHKYNWKLYKRIHTGRSGDMKFKDVTGGSETYEEKYFGLYKSHTDGVDNKDTYADDRAVIWKNKKLRNVLVVWIVAAGVGLWYLVGFFKGDVGIVEATSINSQQGEQEGEYRVVQIRNGVVQENQPVPVQPLPVKEPPRVYMDYFDQVRGSGRLRLSAYMEMGGKVAGVIEVYNDNYRLLERIELVELQIMGWEIERQGYGVRLTKGEVAAYAHPFPIDPFGRVEDRKQQELKPEVYTEYQLRSGLPEGVTAKQLQAGMIPHTSRVADAVGDHHRRDVAN